MRLVGHIDLEKYRCVAQEIATDEVVITDERIQHIEMHHPGDYQKYAQYMKTMVEAPQYILRDTEPNTAVILQEFSEQGECFRLIMKLAVAQDRPGRKNSVITFLRISEKTFHKYLRNKKILYKAE